MSSASSSSSNRSTSPDTAETFFSPAAVEKLHARFPSGSLSEEKEKKKEEGEEEEEERWEPGEGQYGGFRLFKPDADFNIDVNAVVLKEQLAKGSYGVVYAGYYK